MCVPCYIPRHCTGCCGYRVGRVLPTVSGFCSCLVLPGVIVFFIPRWAQSALLELVEFWFTRAGRFIELPDGGVLLSDVCLPQKNYPLLPGGMRRTAVIESVVHWLLTTGLDSWPISIYWAIDYFIIIIFIYFCCCWSLDLMRFGAFPVRRSFFARLTFGTWQSWLSWLGFY